MELKDLVGLHELSGVDFETEEFEDYGRMETCEVCRFRLDGVIYAAVQDPDDGYRSTMRELHVSSVAGMKAEFGPVSVFCIHRDCTSRYSTSDLLEIYDCKTAKLVLVVGTDNTDDYYPSYVSSYTPENMSVNAEDQKA